MIKVIKRTRLEGLVRRCLSDRNGNIIETGEGYASYSRPHTDVVLIEELYNLDGKHVKRVLSAVEDIALSEGRPLVCLYIRAQEPIIHSIATELGYRPVSDSFFLTLYRKELS